MAETNSSEEMKKTNSQPLIPEEMMMMMKKTNSSQPLIPGLPDEISEHCLLHLPYPYKTLVRSVSSSWNQTITNPKFLQLNKTLSISKPFVFVLSSQKSTAKIQWQAFDPTSNRWFILPPMPTLPTTTTATVCAPSFACSSLSQQGVLYVLGGMRSDTESSLQNVITYNTATNQWSVLSPMLTPRSFFAAGSIDGKIFAAGGSGVGQHYTLSSMERYDPENDTWTEVAKMRSGLARYDAAVVGKKMYVTEGWTWPFTFSPRGGAYDSENDTWQEMRVGMREGWTGITVVLEEKLFVISEHGNCRMKFYIPESDTWQAVTGGEFPCEAVQRPYAVSGVGRDIYVVCNGLRVVIGSMFEEEEKVGWRVEWRLVEGTKFFEDWEPCNSQVVYG